MKRVARHHTGEEEGASPLPQVEDNWPSDDDDGKDIGVTFQTDYVNKTDFTDLDNSLCYERETYEGNGCDWVSPYYRYRRYY